MSVQVSTPLIDVAGKLYIWSTIGHRQQARPVVLQCEVLICELFSSVDSPRAGAVAIDEITALDHEVFDLNDG